MVAVVLASIFSIASASDTTTKFKTGPFMVSVDLGMPCNDTNISKPVSSEDLGGAGYTKYDTRVCGLMISILRADKDKYDLTSSFGTSTISPGLTKSGADKGTIALYDRTIDGKSGAVGSGYVPKSDENLYCAGFYVSPKSFCYIYVWGNETMMISTLKTIHIMEAA